MRYALPLPPSANHYYRSIGRGRVLISECGKQYRHNVWALVLEQGRKQFDGRLEVDVQLTMPDHRRTDIDNRIKSLLDALQYAGVYVDDSQIDRLVVERVGVAPPGAALVVIGKHTARLLLSEV